MHPFSVCTLLLLLVVLRTAGHVSSSPLFLEQAAVSLSARGTGALVRLNLSADPAARCLDGSPGAYYVRDPHGAGARRWILFLEGGAFCGSAQDCLERSRTDKGSSLHYPEQMAFQDPYLADSAQANPLLHDWGVAYLKYCDGAYFSGTAGAVTVASGATVHYSGAAILRGVVGDLAARRPDFKAAKEVLVAGSSAGGIVVLAQLDAFRSMLRAKLHSGVEVRGFADSGFYLARPAYVAAKRYIVEGQRAGGLTPRACRADHAEAPWSCFISEVAMAYLRTPVFLWQSRYDTDQQSCEMDAVCRRDPGCIRAYGQELQQKAVTLASRIPGAAVFVDGCDRHCWGNFSSDGEWIPWKPPVPVRITVGGVTPLEALSEWHSRFAATANLRGRPLVWLQTGVYPCSECCGGAGP